MDIRKRLKDVDEVKKYAASLQDAPESTTREIGSSQVTSAAVLNVNAHRVLCLLCKYSWIFLANACAALLLS